MIRKLHKNAKGFTLIELMIVVAIIGILAAIAIPNFRAYQLKSKRAEVPTNLKAIKTSEVAFQAENDTFIALTASPRDAGDTDTQKADWVNQGGFGTLGWQPSGRVYGAYEGDANAGDLATHFEGTGTCDVDDDDNEAVYTFLVDVADPADDQDVELSTATPNNY